MPAGAGAAGGGGTDREQARAGRGAVLGARVVLELMLALVVGK